ncbi:glycosyltransferase [Rhodococcus globerulus]|uniref:glycosyltransferase n=1 Tax=Rhodococcus globerulus TaxID=33008 RepID=UPI000AE8EE9A|nr:glycosyltransferase [Rhodococcus globerulus]
MIGYYIHHHGKGHLTRASAITVRIGSPVTALTSANLDGDIPFADHVRLPLDSTSSQRNPTVNGAFHWAPFHDHGLSSRMMCIAEWITMARPRAIVVDVSVEVAVFVRLMGIPVVVVAMPGQRTDPAHQLVYRIADHIIAAWPREIYEPDWLHEFAAKTSYVGGISRFDGREKIANTSHSPKPGVLVLSGAGGSRISLEDVQTCAAQHDSFRWTALGVKGTKWVDDPWRELCSSDVVITHAGQNSIADVAAAQRPAIVISEDRPFEEQRATAQALSAHNLSVSLPHWPVADRWPSLIAEASAIGGYGWSSWRTTGAADRAAAVIEMVAERLGNST